ncbi:hypothetical protein JHD46_06310 [Sulfurimonas sp. SAG-AH-194-C20]|nr:hypothetical protein [Sulfurimonas sp. SAG-AH-194-C20]MDF1879250.1 hypothetical protein [Sulfurimonas sp. SAG-AH-194-C20]
MINIKNILLSSLVAFSLVGCSGTSDADMREAIDSGDVSEVRDLASPDASYSVMKRENGRPLMEYANAKGGTAMAEALLDTKLTELDLEFFMNKGMPACMRTSNQDEDYCECSLEEVYSNVTYLDIIDSTQQLRSAMLTAAQECK